MPPRTFAATGLALVRLTVGALENLGKGPYTPGGYASLIGYYIKHGHAPAAWRAVMALAAITLVAFSFLASLWVSEWGTAWISEILVPVPASLGLAVGRTRPPSPWW